MMMNLPMNFVIKKFLNFFLMILYLKCDQLELGQSVLTSLIILYKFQNFLIVSYIFRNQNLLNFLIVSYIFRNRNLLNFLINLYTFQNLSNFILVLYNLRNLLGCLVNLHKYPNLSLNQF